MKRINQYLPFILWSIATIIIHHYAFILSAVSDPLEKNSKLFQAKCIK